MTWQSMSVFDIPTVYKLSVNQWAPDYYEEESIFLDKFLFSPSTCYMYRREGYIISHPYNQSIIPELNQPLISVEIDCHYIHDIVLTPSIRGQRVADTIIERIIENHPIVCLVAPERMNGYWKRYGFRETGIECVYGKHMIYNR